MRVWLITAKYISIFSEPIELIESEEFEFITKKIKLSGSDETIHTKDFHKENLEYAAPMTCYHLRPRKNIDRSYEVKVSPVEYVKETAEIEGFTESLAKLKKQRLGSSPIERSNQYPKVVFLGTGSCIPNKTRNVSSILIHTTYVRIVNMIFQEIYSF